jgi:hypothetical protein
MPGWIIGQLTRSPKWDYRLLNANMCSLMMALIHLHD